jgi:hypothetical protein
MLYGPDRLIPTGEAVPLEVTPAVKTAASEMARILRARAARYRGLAKDLYNEELMVEVEALARELEAEAAKLQDGSYPYFETPVRKEP